MMQEAGNDNQIPAIVGLGGSAGSIRALQTFFANAGGHWAGFCRGASSFAKVRKQFRVIAAKIDTDAGGSGLRAGKGRGKLCLRDPARQRPFYDRWPTDI